MPHVVHADRVSRTFGTVTALDDVSLVVGAGEAVGVLGPNGAGKSTLLSLLAGLRRPSAGTVRVGGGDPRDPATRTRIGVTPQTTGLPQTLKVREVVDFVAGHHRDPLPRTELLKTFDLTGLAGRQCGALSGGQQRRVCVALAFVGRPDVVMLDEPTTGLDVTARMALWDAVRGFTARGGTLLLTSHHLEEVEALASRVVLVDHGRVVVEGSVAEVRARSTVRRVRWTGPDGPVETLEADADEAVRALVRSGVPFRDLEVGGATLEAAFLDLTGAGPTGAGDGRS